MKNKIYKIAKGFLPVFVLLFFTVSCNNDDEGATGGNFDLATLQTSISQAESLITNSVEGINAGDYQPGSKEVLQSVLNWINKRIATSKSQADINDAVLKIDAAIETFLASTVSVAFPYVQQEDKTYISISENVRPIIAGEFTIQGEFYIVNLIERAFFNNMFALNGFPDSGFTVRYSADGSTRLLVGDGSWTDSPVSAPGVFKAGEWVDVAFTSTGSTQKLYVNGVEIVTMDKTLLLPEGDTSLAIGNSPVFSERSSNLLTRDFTIWNTVLTPEQIQANVTAEFDGTESNLEAYFPFGSDLGDSFSDVTGNYTATLVGDVVWVAEPPVIVIDYSQIDAAIQELTDFRATIVEGDQDGDYPIGTLAYIDELLTGANDTRANEERQNVLDDTAASLSGRINLINNNLVADAQGVYIDDEDPNAVGFRITPNYTPQSDYTYEFDLMLKDLFLPTGGLGLGDVMGNGNIGFRVNGYTELTEANLLNAGGGWNWTNVEGFGYIGPMYPALTLKSGQWHHIAIVHDDTALTTRIYVDGEMVGESIDIAAPIESGWAEIWLGNTFGFKMDGYIKDFRIWDVVRSTGEFDVDITGSESGLQLYFPLERVNGVKFADETGNYSGELRGIMWND